MIYTWILLFYYFLNDYNELNKGVVMEEEVVMDPLASYGNEQVIIVSYGRLLLLYISRTLILHPFKGLEDRYSKCQGTTPGKV